MTDQPPQPARQLPTLDLGPAADVLISRGLLFALNEFVAHGLGYQFVMLPEGRIGIQGDGGRRKDWNDIDPQVVQAAMIRWRQALLDAQAANKQVHPAQHSPGFRAMGQPRPTP